VSIYVSLWIFDWVSQTYSNIPGWYRHNFSFFGFKSGSMKSDQFIHVLYDFMRIDFETLDKSRDFS